jgi:chorismate mutase/prephenate dehydratase
MSLDKLRKKIDLLDQKLISLLNLRAAITKAIGKIKINSGKSIYVPEREAQVLSRISNLSKGPLKKSALEAIYREIMSASLALEKPLKIAYLGPQASFTNLAAMKKFGSLVSYVAGNSITDVFLEVEKGSADYGVVPIE